MIKKRLLRAKLEQLCFYWYFRLPLGIRSFITRLVYKPIIKEGAIIFGSKPLFGPSVEVGEYSYLHSPKRLDNVKIGRFCSIAEGLSVVANKHKIDYLFNYKMCHQYNSPFLHKYWINDEDIGEAVKIGNDVYIGTEVIILGGVKIGDGAVVGAGSIVTKNVEPFSVVAGTPARFIRGRKISKEIREFDFNSPDYLENIDKVISKHQTKMIKKSFWF